MWRILTSDTICSPQAGLQYTHCRFSVDDGEALASYFLLELGVSAMSSSQVITNVQMRGLIKPHKWKCPILSQFNGGYVIHIWHFRYGQERRPWQ